MTQIRLLYLGILSSQIHISWALSLGGQLGPTPVYPKATCFDPFPFPDPTEAQKQKIRDLGERLDAHRKGIQAEHSDVTITDMYNLLEKLRVGEPLTDEDKVLNQAARVSTLKQIHDELDAAVFEAYGWESDLTDDQILENLVKLNADRAKEEENGLVRWLRPEYQAPDEVKAQTPEIPGMEPPKAKTSKVKTPAKKQQWPTEFKDQLAAIRDLLRTQGDEWAVDDIAKAFKGATRSQAKIQAALEALETLGLVAQHTENGQITWYFAELQQAG